MGWPAVVFLDEWEVSVLLNGMKQQRAALEAYEKRVGLEHKGKEDLARTELLVAKLELAIPPKEKRGGEEG